MTQYITMIVINFDTPKATAMNELLFNKAAFDNLQCESLKVHSAE